MDRKIDRVIAIETVGLITRVLSIFAVIQGIGIIVGGRERWSSASYKIALTVPGAPPTWGYLILLPGLAVLVGTFYSARAVIIGLFVCSGWSMFFALSFAVSAFSESKASFGGVWSYAALAVVYVTLAMSFKESRKAGSSAL